MANKQNLSNQAVVLNLDTKDDKDDNVPVQTNQNTTIEEMKKYVGNKLSEAEEAELMNRLNDPNWSIVVPKPPDYKLARAAFESQLKNEYKKSAVLFACQMACQGFKGKDVFNSVSVIINKQEVKLSDAVTNKDFIKKYNKSSDVLNPRRICLAYARVIRKYVQAKQVQTTTMKKYNSSESFLFVGGQGSIDNSADAQKMVRLVAEYDGLAAANKLIKYFRANAINVSTV